MVREYSPNELHTNDTSYREHEASAHAKRVTSVQVNPPQDPNNKLRSLKPTSVALGANGTTGFDMLPNSTYLFIANDECNVFLAAEAGVAVPDASDLLIPSGSQFVINTGTIWRRLEVFSGPPANTVQLLKIK